MYATNPSGGVLVRCGNLQLQFVGSSAFVLTTKGMLTKSVKGSEYAFLTAAPST